MEEKQKESQELDERNRDQRREKSKKAHMRRQAFQQRNINIPFTYSRAQRPLDVIVQELGDYIEESDLPPFVLSIVSNPTSIIGKNVKQKFEHEDTHIIEWYCGSIVDYDALSKIFEIKYEGEEELCKFDIVSYSRYNYRYVDLLT